MMKNNPAVPIRCLEGTTDILIIAPHAPVINGVYENDIRTGVIAEELHALLGCTTIINDRYFKPKGPIKKDAANFFLDVFRIDHARKVPGYLEMIENVIAAPGKTLVLWIHGIADDVAESQGTLHKDHGVLSTNASQLCALIGYGQGGDPKAGDDRDGFTARQEQVELFAGLLTRSGMVTVPTWPGGPNFRGRDEKRLNQWFRKKGLDFARVESLQLEIREKGFRDSKENARRTAGIIAAALKELTGK